MTKRFTYKENEYKEPILCDNFENKEYPLDMLPSIDELIGLLNKQHETSKNKDKLIKHHNNKIKKLNKEKRFILHTIHNKLLKYKEESQDTKYDNFNTPDYYQLRGKIEVLTNLEDILESHEVITDD